MKIGKDFIKNNNKCVVTYIDFAGAFTSVSHKYIDNALKEAKASRKTRALFRIIYRAAQGSVRVQGVGGEVAFSTEFDICRGVIHRDIISPIFFVIALDQFIQSVDTKGKGVNVGLINELRVLGYADDHLKKRSRK